MRRKVFFSAAFWGTLTVVFVFWLETGDRSAVYRPELDASASAFVAVATTGVTFAPTMPIVEIASPPLFIDTVSSYPSALRPQFHIVQAGETLFGIATMYSISIEELAAANHLADPAQIYVGQSLQLPSGVPGITTATAGPSNSLVATLPQTIIPLAFPVSVNVNGIPLDDMIRLPGNVTQHIRQIYAQGQAAGRNPRAFSKIGDSTFENPHFLARFDSGPYNLGDYAYLQSVIDYFYGSFGRQGAAVRRGLHSWSVLDPMWADKTSCAANKSPMTCELRLHNPSVVFIRLGANDVGIPASFDRSMRQIVEVALNEDIIPILSTKPDRREVVGDINNGIIRQIASDYAVPLWDFDRVAQTLPGSGLEQDGVHLTTFYAHDYRSPVAFQRGNGVHNLTALMALDLVWRATR